MKSYPRAFTLVELLLAVVIVTVLAMALFTNFSRSILKARFDDQVLAVTSLIEKARSYSLTNVLILDTEAPDYYLLTVTSASVRLDAYGPTLDEELETVTLDNGFSISNITGSEYAFYFPPEGDICFDTPDCASGVTEISFDIEDSAGTYSETISIDAYGGYPQVGD